ncbi:MAG: hypothetical protein L6367_04415 [Cellulomonas sp.]|nr:hypothetical protein [Cellulomonas sp.]
MITIVATGRSDTRPSPNAARGAVARDAAATQSTHWMPTGAGRWHWGQVGRPQRWHRTYATVSGWRGQTGACGAASGIEMVSPRW